MTMGTRADLARLLGISRSAVSQALKRYFPQMEMTKELHLEYYAFELGNKQNPAQSQAQREAKKQLPGLKNPRVHREVIRRLSQVWDEAIKATINTRAEVSFESYADVEELENYWWCCLSLWDRFHEIVEREFPADLADHPFQKPEALDFDWENLPVIDHVKKIVCLATEGGDVDYSKMPIDELERLVLSSPDVEIGSDLTDEIGRDDDE